MVPSIDPTVSLLPPYSQTGSFITASVSSPSSKPPSSAPQTTETDRFQVISNRISAGPAVLASTIFPTPPSATWLVEATKHDLKAPFAKWDLKQTSIWLTKNNLICLPCIALELVL
ncbi:unnamed protein product [Protopolystoma xenopodis]|uniref:Uncharacterized protein n=1 Tax=Protopolystoma xenopodis TaxID=117903 RepID=A0A3S5ABK0_9PLAT|nr:unnamed protein product [Protopolystoma xenopodis]